MHVGLHTDDYDDGHMHATPTDGSVHLVSHFLKFLYKTISPANSYYI